MLPNSEDFASEAYYFGVAGDRRRVTLSGVSADRGRRLPLLDLQGESQQKRLVLNRSLSPDTTSLVLTGEPSWCLMLSAERVDETAAVRFYFPAQEELLGNGRCYATPPIVCQRQTQRFELVEQTQVPARIGWKTFSLCPVWSDGTRSPEIVVDPTSGELSATIHSASPTLLLHVKAGSTSRQQRQVPWTTLDTVLFLRWWLLAAALLLLLVIPFLTKRTRRR